MVHQNFIDFTGADFFATAVDDFFESASNADIALFIHHTLVTRSEPSMCESFCIGFVVVLITWRDVIAANHNFASAA